MCRRAGCRGPRGPDHGAARRQDSARRCRRPAGGGGSAGGDPAPAGGDTPAASGPGGTRTEEHTSELQSLMRTSYAVFCLNKKNIHKPTYSPYNLIFTDYINTIYVILPH